MNADSTDPLPADGILATVPAADPDDTAEMIPGSMSMSMPDDTEEAPADSPDDAPEDPLPDSYPGEYDVSEDAYITHDYNCTELEALYEEAPGTLGGSDMMYILDLCKRGEISTTEEVTAAIEKYEGPNPTVDDQIANLADKICAKALVAKEETEVLAEINAACAVDPRDNDHILDLIPKLHAEQHPEAEEDDEGKVILL